MIDLTYTYMQMLCYTKRDDSIDGFVVVFNFEERITYKANMELSVMKTEYMSGN